jgi:hypothetical protein
MCPDSFPGKKGSMRLLNNILPICAAITIAANGCSRKPAIESNAQTNQVVENTNPVPAAPSGPISAPIVQAQGQVDMVELNRVARFWMLRNRRRPTDWDDFVAHAGVQIPPPPAGKKYVLSQNMRVTLADQ